MTMDFELNVDGSAVPIRYAEVGKTRLAPDWSRKTSAEERS